MGLYTYRHALPLRVGVEDLDGETQGVCAGGCLNCPRRKPICRTKGRGKLGIVGAGDHAPSRYLTFSMRVLFFTLKNVSSPV